MLATYNISIYLELNLTHIFIGGFIYLNESGLDKIYLD